MEFVDFLAHYMYALRAVLIVTAVCIIISSIDDLIVDVIYWVRTIYRSIVIRRIYKPMQVEHLYLRDEDPFAVIVPAWKEAEVIRHMIENTLNTYEYNNYHIFVGVYQNDPETQAEVRAACEAHDTVHMTIVPNDGPTCKADCLNWLLQGLMAHEQKHNIRYVGVVMHDAEDVVHRLELKLFNYLIERMDLMQLPVFSLESPWYQFTAGHYIDEFAEGHSKNMLVREILTGAVPSAGVATCFSRRAIDALAAENENVVFNTDSLTEDYDISFRLKALGMKQIFLRYGVMTTVQVKSPFTGRVKTRRVRDYVATREFFPDSIDTARRQKARWILGIVFQGWQFIGWRGTLGMRYMLMRDRKSVFTAFVTSIAYYLFINIALFYLAVWMLPKAYRFPPLIEIGSFAWWLMVINLGFLLNRIAHRMLFTGRIYGWEQALLSVPRMVVGNFVAFLAASRAVKQFTVHMITGKPMVWDKTTHAYPSVDQLQLMRRRLGEMLVERHSITQTALDEALLRQKKDKRPLGEILLEMNAIPRAELVQALSEHMRISIEQAEQELSKKHGATA